VLDTKKNRGPLSGLCSSFYIHILYRAHAAGRPWGVIRRGSFRITALGALPSPIGGGKLRSSSHCRTLSLGEPTHWIRIST